MSTTTSIIETLTLSKSLTLPLLEAVTQTFAILGKRGSGKTTTATVLVEELLAAGQHVVVIDPLDVVWGLRASRDGKKTGFEITVLGGDHGDLPLEASAGAVIAEFVVEHHVPLILSLRHFSMGDQRRFVTDFCERLYALKGKQQHRTALHLVIDESDEFAPQRIPSGHERMFGAIDRIVRRGRASGLGVTLISQRAAVLHKDVLSQAEVLICHQTVSPQDRKALEAWIDAHDAHNQGAAFMASLASLQRGEAWVWSPGWLNVFERVQVRDRTTFDSSATPKAGETSAAPKHFAAVDLKALEQRMADTIEKAKADDPRELKKRIAELRVEVERRRIVTGKESGKNPPAALTDADREHMRDLAKAIRETVATLDAIGATLVARIEPPLVRIIEQARAEADEFEQAIKKHLESKGLQKILTKLEGVATAPGGRTIATPSRRVTPTFPSVRNGVAIVRPGPNTNGTGTAREEIGSSGAYRMLVCLAQQHPSPCTSSKLAILTGIARTGGTFRTYLGKLRTLGWVEGAADALCITWAGMNALGPYDPLPTGPALIDYWRQELGTSGARAMFDAVVDVYPKALTKTELADRTNIAETGGTFRTYLGKLRTMELIDRKAIRASDVLFD